MAKPYELVRAAAFMPTYLRGEACLGKSAEAVVEFQKILDRRGVNVTSEFYPLAHLGAARAYKVMGDQALSLREYEEFFKLWTSADEDVPVLKRAKTEYARLQ